MNFIHLHRKHSALETPPVTVDFWIFLVRETTRIRYARVSICWSVHLPLGSIPLPTRLLTEASTAVLSSRLSGWEAQKAQEASLCNTHRAVCQALHLLKRSPLGAVSSPGGPLAGNVCRHFRSFFLNLSQCPQHPAQSQVCNRYSRGSGFEKCPNVDTQRCHMLFLPLCLFSNESPETPFLHVTHALVPSCPNTHIHSHKFLIPALWQPK